MRKLIFIISLLLGSSSIFAQNVIHLCVGDSAQNFAVPLSIGSTYQWSVNGNANIATITTGNGTEHILIDLNNPGIFWLNVVETDANLCNGNDSILVEVHPLPNPLIYSVGNTDFCEGDFVTLISDSMYNSLNWNNGLSSSVVDIYNTGNYFVLVSDTNGCTNTSNTIDVIVHPLPNADFWIDGVCFESETHLIDASTISSGNIVSWIWNLGDGSYETGQIVSHMYNSSDIFNVQLKVITDFGCEDSITKNLQIFHIPTAEFEYNPYSASTLRPEITFTNTSINAIPILWDFDDGTDTTIENPIHVFSEPGTYEVMMTVSDTNDCFDSTSHKITIYYDFILYVPNSFTPDGDGNNETFAPKGFRMGKYQSYQFIIYNRWGTEVFSTDKVGEAWDGKNATAGKYAWIILITDEMGSLQKKVGEVLLIK